MSFETALTGLKAASTDLDVTGNNVANSSTIGFKQSRAEFADIFASSNLGAASNAVGQGVRLSDIRQQFTQGGRDYTGNALDLAIDGTGFFRVNDGGNVAYTRAGAFELDRDGFVSNAQGQQLTGFLADAQGNVTGQLGPLSVQTGDVNPRATGGTGVAMSIVANLDAQDNAIDPLDPTLAFDRLNPRPEQYNFSTSTTVFDSLGREHVQTLYFRKDADNTWTAYAEVEGVGSGARGPIQLNFDQNGVFSGVAVDNDPTLPDTQPGVPDVDPAIVADVSATGPNSAEVAFSGGPLGGANELRYEIDFSSLTQFGTPFAVTRIDQDGYAAGQFSSLSVEGDGTIFARYTNGQSQVLGQVALANFPAPESLQNVGGTSWVETFASGQPVMGNPGDGGLGVIEAGALEQSNVDLTEQLVKMITAQRNYSANAQMISTQDQLTREILNIRG
ncbi:flagellar hook protein FlgE [Alkalilimnicola sp. S0819]|uniref:flagellar hook protein FlgE n=1 Tax=Alkalilimnicola sp. S0819 TaxID=2613922 RepID=UPI00126171BE|nr:flagellar hook protein FlgE [Alkalilimnicola sp. S0819]KAB7627198.1 flagellar hook protein FlgE [Alkalilimnicola sp. S0819]MPQ15911.1 flagellar hook-basal body complex protein [Alkalilimnicola sp. S0819]